MKKSKNGFKRAFSVFLAFSMLAIPLTACGGSKGGSDEGLSEFVYVPEYTSIPKEVTDISNPYLVGDTVYFSSNVPIHSDGSPATQEEIDAMNNGGIMYKEAVSSTSVAQPDVAATEAPTEAGPEEGSRRPRRKPPKLRSRPQPVQQSLHQPKTDQVARHARNRDA